MTWLKPDYCQWSHPAMVASYRKTLQSTKYRTAGIMSTFSLEKSRYISTYNQIMRHTNERMYDGETHCSAAVVKFSNSVCMSGMVSFKRSAS